MALPSRSSCIRHAGASPGDISQNPVHELLGGQLQCRREQLNRPGDVQQPAHVTAARLARPPPKATELDAICGNCATIIGIAISLQLIGPVDSESDVTPH